MPVTFGFVILIDSVLLWLFISWTRKGPGWADLHRLAWLAGLMGFFLVFNVLGDLQEVFQGKILVSLAAVLGLWRLYGVIRKRQVETNTIV